jgi:soluble lytic murein transglycosylase-like protein
MPNAKFRALRARLRVPLVRVLVPVSLIGFGAAFGGQDQLEDWDDMQDQARLEASWQTTNQVAATTAALGALQEAWRAKTLDDERQRVAALFAQQFRISEDLAGKIHAAALQENVDPHLAFRLVRAESSFEPQAVSPVGAVGLTQLMPATAQWLEPGIASGELMEPSVNLRVGFRYLRMLLDQYRGNTKLALTAYNRGPGTVDRLIARGRKPGNGYAEFVLDGASPQHVSFMKKSLSRQHRS